MEVKNIPIGKLAQNEGQIEGLPANPRSWTDEDVDSLAQSLLETPELFEARPIIAVKHGKEYVVLGGNLRTVAAEAAGMDKVPVVVLPPDTTIDKMKEIVIKDNGSFGAWDYRKLNKEWPDGQSLNDWGVKGYVGIWVDGEDAMPEELQGESLDAEELPEPDVQGDDETVRERVIITYDEESRWKVEELLGPGATGKVLWTLEDIQKLSSDGN